MKEPEYYARNGLSPLQAFKQGLMSEEEYIGFCKGNIIKYVTRAGKKGFAVKDLLKARNYINHYLDIFTMDDEERELFLAPWNPEFEKDRPEKAVATDIPITVKVENDLDFDDFAAKIGKALEEANTPPEIIDVETDDPFIREIKISEAMFDDDGKLKPHAREKIAEYIKDRRNHV